MVVAETFLNLLSDKNHWAFEIVTTIVQDVGIGLVAWPLIKRAVRRHDAHKHGA